MSIGSNMTWIGLGLVAFAFLAPSFPGGGESEPVAASATDGEKPARAASAPSVRSGGPSPGLSPRSVSRSADGHFYLDARVNGAPVRFMVDTGATMVALTPADARRAGIALPSEREIARGAGGEIEVIPVTIDRISAGEQEARGVRGAVVEELSVSLLGQSFLREVGSVEISGDRMTLR